MIEKRRRDGHHTELAVQLLDEMEQSLRLHKQDRDRLRRELRGDDAELSANSTAIGSERTQ
jgi:hypothetical protein